MLQARHEMWQHRLKNQKAAAACRIHSERWYSIQTRTNWAVCWSERTVSSEYSTYWLVKLEVTEFTLKGAERIVSFPWDVRWRINGSAHSCFLCQPFFRPYEHACCQPLTLMGPKPLACPQAIVSYLFKATFKGVGLTPQKNIVIVFTNVLKCMSECVGSLCAPCHYVFCTTSHMFRGRGACRTEITCHSHPLPQAALFFFHILRYRSRVGKNSVVMLWQCHVHYSFLILCYLNHMQAKQCGIFLI